MNIAAKVRLQKARNPGAYCQGSPSCLWRVQTRNGTSPCPRHPLPQPVQSEYASTLGREMAYQGAVTAFLLATTRPLASRRGVPMFSQPEIAEMDRMLALGISAEAYGAILAARDRTQARIA